MLLGQNLWRIRVHRMEMQRLAAKIRGLTSEVKAYQFARDCYKVLCEYDEAKKKEDSK